jgi:hypothetical protein
MRGAVVWIAVAAGVALVLVVTAAIGTRDDRDETVPAGKYAQSVCGAFGVWRGQIQAIVEDIRTPNASSTAGGEEPQSETSQGRTGFVRKGLERAVQATETMVEAVDNAGVPDTPQGEASAELVSEWAGSALDDLEAAQDSLEEEADSLEGALEQVTGAVSAIGGVLVSGVQTDVEIVRTDPELAAVFLQTSTCQELRQETGQP